jgi:DNA-directed RNA polymerase subunit RPC12/RpoP
MHPSPKERRILRAPARFFKTKILARAARRRRGIIKERHIPKGEAAMQRRFDVLIPLGCPYCNADISTTVDEIAQLQTIKCPECGAGIDLKPEEHLPPPPIIEPPADQMHYGVDFL